MREDCISEVWVGLRQVQVGGVEIGGRWNIWNMWVGKWDIWSRSGYVVVI